MKSNNIFHNTTTPVKEAPRRVDKSISFEDKHLHQLPVATRKQNDAATRYHHSAWTVMAVAQFYKKLISSTQTIRITNLFILFLLLPSVTLAKPKGCVFDKCTGIFHAASNSNNRIEKCRLLFSLEKCMRPYRIPCAGKLNYYSVLTLSSQIMAKLDCASLPSYTTRNSTVSKTNQCMFAGKPKYTFCSVFGDPHVRTFSDQFHTCKANGSWSLINNDYLVVKATNSLLEGRMGATAISKLSVMIKKSGACADSKTYIADVGDELPRTFTDGSNHTGQENSVVISEGPNGKEIQINIRFIGTTVIVRNGGTHLSISIQMPEEIATSPIDKRKQMCVKGCPRRQRIRLSHELKRILNNPKEERPAKKYSENEARTMCRDALLEQMAVNEQLERPKRSVDTPKNKGKSNNKRRQKSNFDLDAATTTWKQLSQSLRLSAGDINDARIPSRKTERKNREKQSNRRTSRRTSHPRFGSGLMHDDPSSYDERGGRRGRSRGQVSSVSRGENFYFEACVFDLMTTGDPTYTSSACGAFSDVTKFHKSGSKAKGASMKVVDSWTYSPSTTSLSTKTTKRPALTTQRRIENTFKPGNSGSRTISSINIFVLFFCLFLNTYILNISQFLGLYVSFFNNIRIGT